MLGAMTILAFVRLASAFEGHVIDAATGKGIADATVTSALQVIKSGGTGHFTMGAGGETVMARAPGYRAVTMSFERFSGTSEVRLEPFQPKALYLSFYGIGYKPTRDAALNLIRESHLNALTIDVKGDRGLVAYHTAVTRAREIAADRITTIPDLPGLLRQLHAEGIYAIARIVVFKDEPLAEARPDLAVKDGKGGIFRDRERLAWTDPFRHEVWDYNVAIAVEAS